MYPPCEINHLKKLQHIPDPERIAILSVGQFRPEKDHPLQLQAMYELRSMLIQDEALWNKVSLLIHHVIACSYLCINQKINNVTA